MKYNKPPLILQEQLNHISKHYKIKFKNEELAKNYLLHCNYYKLRGYWLFFEEIEKEAYFEEVIKLILKHNIPIKYMGFPKNHNIKGLENAKYEY